MSTITGLPAGIGLSQVRVYTSEAPDGQCGGTPHLHLTCTEMYLGVRGIGEAEFLTTQGPMRVSLEPGVAVQFTPGTVHRLINGADPLEMVVIMENGRLNEEGDVTFAFPDADLADADRYAGLADVGPGDAPDPAAVQRRRDRAVLGFTQRVDVWRQDPRRGREELDLLYHRAVQLVGPKAAQWPKLVADGPAKSVERLARRAAATAGGDPTELTEGRVTVLPRFDETALVPRMCGHLWSYAIPDPARSPTDAR
jgi:uncharacterized cupin superfamily protein